MDELVIKVQTPLQRRIVEQAPALAKELERVADDAPDGHVLDRGGQVAPGSGRESLRQALTAAWEQQAQAVEERGRPADAAPAAPPAGTRAGPRGGS